MAESQVEVSSAPPPDSEEPAAPRSPPTASTENRLTNLWCLTTLAILSGIPLVRATCWGSIQ